MDIKCAVCGEPWDHYLDMLPWEKALFRQGAGCPCCEGETPIDMSEDEEHAIIRDRLLFNPLETGDLELVGRLSADGSNDARPEWKRPDPVAIWTCDGCSVSAATDPDDGSIVWYGGDKVHYSHGYAASYGGHYGHEDPDDPIVLDGRSYCPGCVETCDHCGETFERAADALVSHPSNYYQAVCVECYCEIKDEETAEWLDSEWRSACWNCDIEDEDSIDMREALEDIAPSGDYEHVNREDFIVWLRDNGHSLEDEDE
jgi:hypothetical protein